MTSHPHTHTYTHLFKSALTRSNIDTAASKYSKASVTFGVAGVFYWLFLCVQSC